MALIGVFVAGGAGSSLTLQADGAVNNKVTNAGVAGRENGKSDDNACNRLVR